MTFDFRAAALAFMNEAVASGNYATTSEVIREALRDWKQKRFAQMQHIEELKKLWEEGLDSGAGHFESIEEIKQEARKRAKQI